MQILTSGLVAAGLLAGILSGCSGSVPATGGAPLAVAVSDAQLQSAPQAQRSIVRPDASAPQAATGPGPHLDIAQIAAGGTVPEVTPEGSRRYRLRDGSSVLLGADGLAVHTDAGGHTRGVLWMPLLQGRGAFAADSWPASEAVERRVAERETALGARSLIVVFASARAAAADSAAAEASLTTEPAANEALRAIGARSLTPLLPRSHLAAAMAGAPAGQLNLSQAYVVSLAGADPVAAVRRLKATPGVVYAVPNWIVSPMNVGPRHIPASVLRAAPAPAAALNASAAEAGSLPGNAGIAQSIQSYLNANGVDALGAYAEIASRFGQLPGAGTLITNVSLGDLTDESMADAGDTYVQIFGPTTVVRGGQRYLDFPSLPLIPTYAVDSGGTLDPLGSVEGVDPSLGEVLLDFSVMAPLPHGRQRPGAVGQGYLDLLGIASGASYRLVVPKQPTIANLLVALMAAANQLPRPDVITASIGYGFDGYGFPGRYIEDDPLSRAVVQAIVRSGIVVTLSANDGLRLFTNAAIGVDGGAAPTELASEGGATSVADDEASSIPSLVPDSGAIAVGGSTLDDVFSAPPQWHSSLAEAGAFPETRYNGGTYYASGFGSRVNVSAPSDNIAVLVHQCTSSPCAAQDAVPTLEGGTSASAPMTAAGAAVLKQVARLTGADLTPEQVRRMLMNSARRLPNPPQADRSIAIGPQIDITAAVETLLAQRHLAPLTPAVVRIGVAERQNIGDLGASFVEGTDRTAIDLTGPLDFSGNPSGQNSVSPITLAADVIGVAAEPDVTYRWAIDGHVVASGESPSLRLLPADILAAAGLPLVSTQTRKVHVTLDVMRERQILATGATSLTFSASSGLYEEALAPRVATVLATGQPLRVHYDLSHVSGLNAPLLVLSNVGHWNPATGEVFRTAWSVPLTAAAGDAVIPATAFAGGAGLYGVGIETDSGNLIWGEFAPVQVAANPERASALETQIDLVRPPAPEIAPADGGAGFGHSGAVTRAAPSFEVRWDVSGVPGADGALLEISSPGPTIRFLYSTFQNPNGDRLDENGVDTPSRHHLWLSGAAGSKTLDALALGLPTSMFYTVRVFAASGEALIGQASPYASLSIDDGQPPGGGEVIDFDVPASAPAAVTIAQAGPATLPGLLGASIYRYDPRRGLYGDLLTGDVTGALDLHVVGTDPALGTLVVELSNVANDEYIKLFGTDGTLRSTVHLDVSKDPFLLGARVDPARHRAAILGWASADYADLILPFDLTSGSLGAAIAADVGTPYKSLFTGLDLDGATGKIYPAGVTYGDLCIVLRAGSFVTSVDLGAGAALPVVQGSHCITGVASDQQGGALHATIGPTYSFPMFPPGRTQQFDATTLAQTSPVWIDGRGVLYPVIDPVNKVMLAGFMAAEDYFFDNSATSAVGVFDLATGRRLALLRDFNLLGILSGSNYFELAARGIQIDPLTRTGWTYGPLNSQVEEFHY